MKIKLINHNSEQSHLKPGSFFRATMDFFSDLFQDEPITWGESGSIFAITNFELDEYNIIPWEELNIICAETCQQIYDNIYKIDKTKSYIFLSESYVDLDHLKQKFLGIPIIAHYAVLNEIFNYGTELFSPRSYLTTVKRSTDKHDYDFFCLVGRKTNLRSKFMYFLERADISNSLVKYNGVQNHKSKAPNEFDKLDYRTGFYDGSKEYLGMRAPSKLVQQTLYDNFKFEIQIETDSVGGNGWDLIEYHVTEKTIKPLIMGKPCLMFGPVNYNNWLSTFGIDLGHKNFKFDYDSIEDDFDRATAMADYVKTLDFSTVVSSEDTYEKNIIGFNKLCQMSKDNTLEMYKKIKLISSGLTN